ncbi:hypothetical protein, partial [Kribbella turkmenica]|uniref:hypothetical protein n=1 Tax=Kribbella turkmenica TaxID=2530375 RepID=UPI00140558BF
SCRPKPPPPAVCDAQCQLNKKIIKEREELEQGAKNIPQPSPGDPSRANGNPALCPVAPNQPATVVGAQDDLTDETSAWSDQQYQSALDEVGSVVDSVANTGGHNWLSMGMTGDPSLGDRIGGWFGDEPIQQKLGKEVFVDPLVETYEACEAAVQMEGHAENWQQCKTGLALTALGFTGGGKVGHRSNRRRPRSRRNRRTLGRRPSRSRDRRKGRC